jgi:hypothetical protein
MQAFLKSHHLGRPFTLVQQTHRAASALLMQYFPKDMELTDITEGQAQEVVKRQL